MNRRCEERSYWDSISRRYDGLYTSRWSRDEDEELKEWLREAVGCRAVVRILDVGCGTGLAYGLVRQISPDCAYTGIDLSEGMLRKFREKFATDACFKNVELHVGDAGELSRLFPEPSFDLIVLTNAAGSYAGPTTKVLRDCQRLLRGDGTLFASFLNRSSLRRCIGGKRGAREVFNTRGADQDLSGVPATVITEKELLTRCRRAGLRVKWVRHQSVLGGVAEMDWLRPVEAVAQRLLPGLGHTVNVLAGIGVSE